MTTLTTRPLRSVSPVAPTGELLLDGEQVPHGEGNVGPVARFGAVSRVIAVRDGDADVTVAGFDLGLTRVSHSRRARIRSR